MTAEVLRVQIFREKIRGNFELLFIFTLEFLFFFFLCFSLQLQQVRAVSRVKLSFEGFSMIGPLDPVTPQVLRLPVNHKKAARARSFRSCQLAKRYNRHRRCQQDRKKRPQPPS